MIMITRGTQVIVNGDAPELIRVDDHRLASRQIVLARLADCLDVFWMRYEATADTSINTGIEV
jgi:hypothetical protein